MKNLINSSIYFVLHSNHARKGNSAHLRRQNVLSKRNICARGSHSYADFSKAMVALKIDILKKEKHFIVIKLHSKSIIDF